MLPSILQESQYAEQQGSGVWMRPDYPGIPYSDGDQIEDEIEQVIDSCTDRSVHSAELARHLDTWAKKYHLSAGRGHLLRPLEHILRGKSVLEIGAGCGAITRYLGEAGAQVVALEGSPRRARICRKRTAGLASVQVVCERFGDFSVAAQFDVVTLIGVLEYAAIYGAAQEPHLDMLRQAKRFLKPGGVLLVAIENQLGLKYFAGALEDHLGEPFYGIESHYGSGQAKTFGRKELQALAKAAGFDHQVVMAPFPDYKLPSVVVTEAGFADCRFNAAALISPTETSDEQSPELPILSQFRTWPAVLRNGLGMELSNSFLMVVSDHPVDTDRSVLAHYFGGQRGPGHFKHSVFMADAAGCLVVADGGGRAVDRPSGDGSTTPYLMSTPLVDQLHAILTSRRSGVEDVVGFFKRYRDAVFQLAQVGNNEVNPTLPAHFLDAIPQNILIDGAGHPQLIDSEWTSERPLQFGQLLFRAVVYSLNGCRLIRLAGEEGEISLKALMTRVFSALGIDVTPASLDDMARMEGEFQKGVNALADVSHWDESKDAPIRRPDLYISHASLKRALDGAAHTIAMFQDNEKNMRQVIAGLEQHVRGLEGALEAIKNSTSWRITEPLRSLTRRR
jgi:O-antigen biosynthesis protein